MRITAISDQHGHLLNNIPECDLLLIAGDICPLINHDPYFQVNWLDDQFRKWLHQQPAKHIVGISGHHDFVWERAASLVPQDLPWTYLQDSGCEIEGLKIWGSPWTPYFNNWAFNLDKDDPNESRLTQVFSQIPNDTDILMTHGPPYGIVDEVCESGSQATTHIGSYALEKVVMEVEPLVHVFGNLHRSGFRMIPIENKDALDEQKIICFYNVTIVNESYDPVYDPTLFEIDAENKRMVSP